MHDLLEQIEKALECNLYYLALQSTLALPDICGALESENGQANRTKYINWYNTYAKEDSENAISGDDCYKFRCSAIHQGSTEHSNSSYDRIMFIEPCINSICCHNNIINNALNIDLRIFCNNMISAVRKWLTTVEQNPNFTRNYAHFMKRYPEGLSPYIGGVPVIS